MACFLIAVTVSLISFISLALLYVPLIDTWRQMVFLGIELN